MADWNTIFREHGKFFNEAHEDMPKLSKLLKKDKATKILDLGCGTGRHTVFLAKQGFDVVGMDNAASGLSQTRKWLKSLNLKAKLNNADCYKKFPFKDGEFDALISVQVMHHSTLKDLKFCISEMERVLKPRSLIFVTVPKTKKNKFRTKIKMIAPRTFVPLDGHEIGVPHYLFNKQLLRQHFKNFKILDLYVDQHKHYCLLGRLK